MVGFRNIIAHDYEKINYDIVYEVLHKGVKDIGGFMGRIGGYSLDISWKKNFGSVPFNPK